MLLQGLHYSRYTPSLTVLRLIQVLLLAREVSMLLLQLRLAALLLLQSSYVVCWAGSGGQAGGR